MKIFHLTLLLLILLSCNLLPQSVDPPATPAEPPVETPAAAEPTAAPEPTETPEPAAGQISGRVCYPSEFIPEMTAYFLNTGTETYTELPIAENQDAYEIALEPGTYVAFAWRGEFGLGGGYTAAVACGMGESCTNRSLLPFQVLPAQMTGGVDLCDWILQGLPLPPDAPLPEGFLFPELAGLVFSAPDGLHQIDERGLPKWLYGQPEALLSRDGITVIYPEADDLWLAAIDSGSPRNITNTPDRVEWLDRGWQAGDQVLFKSHPVDMEMGPGVSGFLTIVNADGSGYQVLDPEEQAWVFALSPDQTRVAYGLGNTGRIYDLALGEISTFDPAEYGLAGIDVIGSPAWSPDGQHLSWAVGIPGAAGGPFTFGLAVFNLADKTHQLIHPRPIPGMDGFPFPAVWSPNGDWLAAQVFDLDFNSAGLWVFDLAGVEIHLGGDNPLWSPDGNLLLYRGQDGELMLTNPGTWESTPAGLPSQSRRPVDWR